MSQSQQNTHKFVPPDILYQVKQITLFNYLMEFEPGEIVRAGVEYSTREHDSVMISPDGPWYRHSTGDKGRSALDYLLKVRGIRFTEAAWYLYGCIRTGKLERSHPQKKSDILERVFTLPPKSVTTQGIMRYLTGRGIDEGIIAECIREGWIYESTNGKFHNAVFLGRDENGVPRYGFERGMGERLYRHELSGSDKRYSFSLPAGESNELIVAESAIDALSLATLNKLSGLDWKVAHYLSIGGAGTRKRTPIALEHYLSRHPEIRRITLCLDNDGTGRRSSECIIRNLGEKYDITDAPPPQGKDYNDYLTGKSCPTQRAAFTI